MDNDAGPVADDRTLLKQLRDGHEEAASVLHGRYVNRLRKVTERRKSNDIASRIDADDIVQSVFRTFFRRVALGQYELPDGNELWGLLLRIAINKVQAAGNYHRFAKRSVRRTEPLTDEMVDSLTSMQDFEAESSLCLTIENILDSFHPTHRQIVQLRMTGLSHEAISVETKRSLRTVERVLHQFRHVLTSELELEIAPKPQELNEKDDQFNRPTDKSG